MSKEKFTFMFLNYPNNYKKSDIVNGIIYVIDKWNDYGFYTTFHAHLVWRGKSQDLGIVNIGIKGTSGGDTYFLMKEAENAQRELDSFPPNVYLLGNQEYYQAIKSTLGNKNKEISKGERYVYTKTNDIAYNQKLYEQVEKEEFISMSFFRNTSLQRRLSRLNQLNQYIRYGITFSDFNWKITFKKPDDSFLDLNLTIKDKEENMILPKNLFALVGPNGAGKTSMLKDIVKSFSDPEKDKASSFTEGTVRAHYEGKSKTGIADIIFISYSAFDIYKDDFIEAFKKENVKYIGNRNIEKDPNMINSLGSFSNNIFKDIVDIYSNSDLVRLYSEIKENFDWDTEIFAFMSKIDRYYEDNIKLVDKKEWVENTFDNFSSGQKMIISTITSLVLYSEANSLFIIDEPELYLHPPYIASLVSTINDIIKNRNSICLVSTHSAIVLQEMWSENIYIIDHDRRNVRHPNIETFGTNSQKINDELFGIDLRSTGYYRQLKQLLREDPNEAQLLIDRKELGFDALLYLKILKRNNDV